MTEQQRRNNPLKVDASDTEHSSPRKGITLQNKSPDGGKSSQQEAKQCLEPPADTLEPNLGTWAGPRLLENSPDDW